MGVRSTSALRTSHISHLLSAKAQQLRVKSTKDILLIFNSLCTSAGELRMENVEVFDVFGRNVGANLRVCPHTAIDISNLQTGIYFVKIRTNAGEVVRKVVKQ